MMPTISKEQQRQLEEVQKFTKNILATIHYGDRKVTVTLDTDDANAKQFIPQIQSATIQSIANALQILFGIEGEVVA